MTLLVPASGHDHFRASRLAVAIVLLELLAALPTRLEAQCTLLADSQGKTLVPFEPNPTGVPRLPTLSSGFNSNVAIYQVGAGGPYRLLMQESFGYSVLDLANPASPAALYYHDTRLPINGPNSIVQHGDAQSTIQTVAVSPDGQRAAFSTTGQASPLQTVVGNPDGANGFTMRGDFFPERAAGTLVQHIGGRYIAYDIHSSIVTASDITSLPIALAPNNLAYETTTWPGGFLASLAGDYILYMAGGAVQVIDASHPGPAGSITAGFPQTTITGSDFGGRTVAYYSAAVDPADATKLWVLVELNALPVENSPSYGLLSVTSSLQKVPAGPTWRVPSRAGELWWSNPGPSSALIPGSGSLFVLMWAERNAPSHLLELYSTTASAWAAVNSSAPPGVFDIPASLSGTFSAGQPMRGFSFDGSIYAYLPMGTSAYVIPMSCVSQNAPAAASMTVADQAGAPLNDGDTVFLGDQITITPFVSPTATSLPLTGFGWNLDFDFHAGAASDDNGVGASPRLRAPDNAAFGSPAAPPATIAAVGPCDPQVAGTSPGSGSGCWTSVTTNGAFGGPDFAVAPAAGSTKALTFALEANNSLGSAGASLFTLNWKVPAARLRSTQILSGQPLVSGSDGHPTATGFKWYFGATPTALARAGGCAGPTCVPTLDTKGTYSYWLTASYANGYVTPDYAGIAAMGTYTVTDFAAAFTVNGSASGPVTAVANQILTVVNSSQRGSGITASYQYSLCPVPCADAYVPWSSMTDPPSNSSTSSATIQVPSTPGSYALKIKVSYTGNATAFWPDPAGAAFFPVSVDVPPLGVIVSVNPSTAVTGQLVTFSCNATGGLAPYSYEWHSPSTSAFVAGTSPNFQTTSPVPGSLQASCFVTDSEVPVPATGSASASATFTRPQSLPPEGPRSITISVESNPTPRRPR